MTCKQIRKNDVIGRYIDGALPAAETDAFVAHCLHCRSCYQSLIREEKLAAFFRSGHGHKLLETIPARTGASLGFRRLSWSAALLVLVVGGVAILFFPAKHQVPERYLKLAEFTAPRYESSLKRSERNANEFNTWFVAGMESYLKTRYKEAVPALQRASELSPQNEQVIFFLGISQLLCGQTDKSVANLKKIADLPANPYSEESHWYLGKAYLKLGKPALAREQFDAVFKMQKKLFRNAEKMLDALK